MSHSTGNEYNGKTVAWGCVKVRIKNAVLWDVAPCTYFVNRRFGETYRVYLQGIRNPRKILISYTLKKEAIRSSETSVKKISTRRHIPEDGILHSHCRDNLKFYKSENRLKFSVECPEGCVILVHSSKF
jgi:hypothetical protein